MVVGGAGAAGIGAALGAARNGARTLLVESESAPGGDLVTGLPILGACNARGEWVAGGVLRDLLERVDALGGYIGPVCDWRAVHGVCVDPEALRLVLAAALRESGVRLLLSAIAAGVDVSEGTITGVRVVTRSGQHDVRARYLVDATGDASLCALAGAPVCAGDGQDHFQPLSLVFRVAGVDFEALLNFAEENPGEFLLAESPVMPTDPRSAPGACASVATPTWRFPRRDRSWAGALVTARSSPARRSSNAHLSREARAVRERDAPGRRGRHRSRAVPKPMVSGRPGGGGAALHES